MSVCKKTVYWIDRSARKWRVERKYYGFQTLTSSSGIIAMTGFYPKSTEKWPGPIWLDVRITLENWEDIIKSVKPFCKNIKTIDAIDFHIEKAENADIDRIEKSVTKTLFNLPLTILIGRFYEGKCGALISNLERNYCSAGITSLWTDGKIAKPCLLCSNKYETIFNKNKPLETWNSKEFQWFREVKRQLVQDNKALYDKSQSSCRLSSSPEFEFKPSPNI